MPQRNYIIDSVDEQTELIQFLDDMIYAHNASQIQAHDGRLFTKVIRDNGVVIAGITGWTWAASSEITLLWVSEAVRKNGYTVLYVLSDFPKGFNYYTFLKRLESPGPL